LQRLAQPKQRFVVIGFGEGFAGLFDRTGSFPDPVGAAPAVGTEPKQAEKREVK
jgi:hypothetical protein